jgi:hypothetical protein
MAILEPDIIRDQELLELLVGKTARRLPAEISGIKIDIFPGAVRTMCAALGKIPGYVKFPASWQTEIVNT